MKIAVLFPGQGSQYIGMGKAFIESDADCRTIMETADQVFDFPLSKLIMEGPIEKLSRAIYLQPAIMVTNLICYTALKKALGAEDKISCYAGHSLGEYSALSSAGVISVEDSFRLVAKRGALMEREGDANPGGMQAVLGLTIEEIETVLAGFTDKGIVTAANHNTEQQVVISGEIAAMDKVGEVLEEKGARIIPLNVVVANHSPLVAGAIPDFKSFIETIPFQTPSVPVYFNVTAVPENDTEKIKEMMARQIASRVRWFEIISNMITAGVDTFIEVGPKTVLKGMIRKIAPRGSKCLALQFDTPEALEKCLKKMA